MKRNIIVLFKIFTYVQINGSKLDLVSEPIALFATAFKCLQEYIYIILYKLLFIMIINIKISKM